MNKEQIKKEFYKNYSSEIGGEKAIDIADWWLSKQDQALKEQRDSLVKYIESIYILEERDCRDMRTTPASKQISPLTEYSKGFNTSLDRITNLIKSKNETN